MMLVFEYYKIDALENARYIDKLVRQSRDYAEMKDADRVQYERLVAAMEKLHFDPNEKPDDPAPPVKSLQEVWADHAARIAALEDAVAQLRGVQQPNRVKKPPEWERHIWHPVDSDFHRRSLCGVALTKDNTENAYSSMVNVFAAHYHQTGVHVCPDCAAAVVRVFQEVQG